MDKVLTILEKISPLLGYYPKWSQWLFVASLAAVLTSFFTFAICYAGSTDRMKGMTRDGTLPALVQMARQPKSDAIPPARYVIESATMLVQLSHRKHASGVEQTSGATVRFIYTVFALDDVKEYEFNDFAHTNVKGAFVAWLAGSEREKISEPGPNNKQWTLGAAIPSGMRRTLVTGAQYSFPEDFAATRTVHDFTLAPHEDAFCYPNDNDVIGELTIMIESDIPLQTPEEGDALMSDGMENSIKREPQVPELRVSRSEGIDRYVVVGRWAPLRQKQNAELRIRRQKP